MSLPVRLSQIDLKENGEFVLGDSSLPGGIKLIIRQGVDKSGGILNLHRLLEFRNGKADNVNQIVTTGELFFDGSVFDTDVVKDRAFRVLHTGSLLAGKLVFEVVNYYTEEFAPNVGERVMSVFASKVPVEARSLYLELIDDIRIYKGKDDGTGNIVDYESVNGSVSGTIDYNTGMLSLIFSDELSSMSGNLKIKYDYRAEVLEIINSDDYVVSITNKSVFRLPVRVSTEINNPQTGMMVFDPSTNTVKVRTAIEWQDLLGGGGGIEVKPVRDIFDITIPTPGPFVLSQSPLGDTAIEKQAGILVFVNGVLVRPVEDYNYNEVSNSIVFINPLEIGDEVQLCYLSRV